VRAEQSFEVQDLIWISAAMSCAIRLTIHADVLSGMAHLPWLKGDTVFGQRPLCAHLLFSWCQSVADDKHCFGHYDLLIPATQGVFTKVLVMDATGFKGRAPVCAWMGTLRSI